MAISLRLALIGLAVATCTAGAAQAEETANAPSTNPTIGSPTSTSPTIKGGVVDLELTNVRDILLDVDRAQAAASHLCDEVTRHPVTTTFSANVVGSTVISMPQPTFDMSRVLPARKSWVDMYMNEIKPIIGYMKQDLDAIRNGEVDLHLDPKYEQKLTPLLTDWSAAIDQGAKSTANLTSLTASEPYNNLAIAKEAADLHKAMKSMKKTGKRVADIMKKSSKNKS